MNDENEFNYSSNNSFKKSSIKHSSSGFGKSVFVPFLSGIVGATLVLGTCFGVPSIKQKLLNNADLKPVITTSSNGENKVVSLSNYSDTSISVAEKVLPSVVGITVTYQISSIFGGSSQAEATGSGIIISEDGYILTNNHVISSGSTSSFYAIQEATGLKVNLYGDSESYDATVVGTDSYTDLAVIKIDKTGLTPATLGDSENVKVGEFVMAIGNPLGMDYSVTCGVVSALNREVESDGVTYTAIQTDAAINTGNSGGALVNANGEVIGINTLKLAGNGVEGVGFAIPISSTTSIVNQLIENKTVKRPYIGISGSAIDSNTAKRYNLPEGVYVESVEKDSPAEKAGIMQKDIITKIEGKEVKSVNELNKIKYTYNIGDTVTLTIYRNNEEIEVKVTLTEMPQEDELENNNQKNNQNQDNGNSQFREFEDDDDFSIFDFFR